MRLLSLRFCLQSLGLATLVFAAREPKARQGGHKPNLKLQEAVEESRDFETDFRLCHALGFDFFLYGGAQNKELVPGEEVSEKQQAARATLGIPQEGSPPMYTPAIYERRVREFEAGGTEQFSNREQYPKLSEVIGKRENPDSEDKSGISQAGLYLPESFLEVARKMDQVKAAPSTGDGYFSIQEIEWLLKTATYADADQIEEPTLANQAKERVKNGLRNERIENLTPHLIKWLDLHAGRDRKRLSEQTSDSGDKRAVEYSNSAVADGLYNILRNHCSSEAQGNIAYEASHVK